MQRREAWLIDPDRRRFDIGEVLVIGRSRECDIVIPSALVQRQHARLTRLPSDEIELEDLGSANGTFIDGQRVTNQVLDPGDEIDIVGQRFRYEQGPPVSLPPDEASNRVTAVWDDDTALQVVIDSLLEQGHPLGQALALGRPQPLGGELEDAVKRRMLVLEWRRGFIHEATIRSSSWLELRPLVDALLRSSVARFLRGLTLPRFERRLRLEATRAPTLERLRFGPTFTRSAVDEATAQLQPLSFPGMPRLRAPVVDFFPTAWLDFGADQRRTLTPGRQESFPTVVVRWDDDRWLVDSDSPTRRVRLNGVSVANAFLLPDDVVQAGPLRFTFRASREAPR